MSNQPNVLLTGAEFLTVARTVGATHVVWLPDSTLGTWESELVKSSSPRLVRVCREGEAWTLAAGLFLGGATPIVVMQNTGFFESGDALRNSLFDLELPLYGVIGVRSYLLESSLDTAKRFTAPLVAAWGVDSILLDGPGQAPRLIDHYRACQAGRRPGLALLAEGKG